MIHVIIMRKQLKQPVLLDFFLREWLLLVSLSGLVITSIYARQLPCYTRDGMQIIFILLALFIAVKGLERSDLIMHISQRIEKGSMLPLKLICLTFFLSMLITNDVALVVIVPLTLALNTNRKDILIILEALAANAGSALTPIGNPQNLFIYWFYHVAPLTFIVTIAPFAIFFLVLFSLVALLVKTSPTATGQAQDDINNTGKIDSTRIKLPRIKNTAWVYGVLLLIVILTVLHLLPVWVGIIVIIYAALFDRGSLHIDYALLLTLVCFLGISGNIKVLLLSLSSSSPSLNNAEHVFIFSTLSSQVISNVPATLLFAPFTTQWKALLWGASVGGFGSLVGSLANLIAYKLYISHKGTCNVLNFTTKFLIAGYIALVAGVLLYFFWVT